MPAVYTKKIHSSELLIIKCCILLFNLIISTNMKRGGKVQARAKYREAVGLRALARIRNEAVYGLEAPDELRRQVREGGLSRERITEAEFAGARVGGSERWR